MIYQLFIGSLILYIFSRLYEKKIKTLNPEKNKIQISIKKGVDHFLIVLACVSFVFCVLQFWIDYSTKIDTTIASIGEIQSVINKIKNYLDYLSIGSYTKIVIIFMTIILGCYFPIVEQFKIKTKFQKSTKLIGNINYILIISTFFTFIKNPVLSDEQKRIESFRTDTLQIIAANKTLLKEIKFNIITRMADKLLNNSEFQKKLDKIEKVNPHIFISGWNNRNSFTDNFLANNNEYSKEIADENFLYSKLKDDNRDWFNQEDLSELTIKKARANFDLANKSIPLKITKYYTRYSEPIKKLLETFTENLGKLTLKQVNEILGVSYPFSDQISDAIINSSIDELIDNNVEAIYKNSVEAKSAGVAEVLKDYTSINSISKKTESIKKASYFKFNNNSSEVNGNASQIAIGIAVNFFFDLYTSKKVDSQIEDIPQGYTLDVSTPIPDKLCQQFIYFDSIEKLNLDANKKIKIIKAHFLEDSNIVISFFLIAKDSAAYENVIKRCSFKKAN